MSDKSKREQINPAGIQIEKMDSVTKNNGTGPYAPIAFNALTEANPFKYLQELENAMGIAPYPGGIGLGYGISSVNFIELYESPAYRFMKEMDEQKNRLAAAMHIWPYGPSGRLFDQPLKPLFPKMSDIAPTLDKSLFPTSDMIGESFRCLHDSFPDTWRTIRTPSVGSILDTLENANKRLQESFGISSPLWRALKEDEEIRKELLDLSSQIFSTGKLLAGLDYDSIGMRLGMARTAFTALEDSIGKTLSAYGNMISSIEKMGRTDYLPTFIIPEATNGIHATARTLHSLQMPDEECDLSLIQTDGDGECIELLSPQGQPLVRMYQGVIDSMKGNNRDRKRHALVSLRELLSALIRILSPEDALNEWIEAKDMRKQFISENNRPTRRARLTYISRGIGNPDLVEYLEGNSKSFNKLYDILSRLHEPDIQLTDTEIWAIIYEAEAKIKFLLKVAKENG